MEKKTEEECWTRFWNILGPAIAELHTKGKWPTDETVADAA